MVGHVDIVKVGASPAGRSASFAPRDLTLRHRLRGA
jgi:hypothetical protein